MPRARDFTQARTNNSRGVGTKSPMCTANPNDAGAWWLLHQEQEVF
jgi:hypothetical protein